ncbi:MAG: two-component system, OmpR family, sensor histidine kinase VicK [Acidimicrobiaceae bacterium]|jgi:PAS domain S-box-containing protein|nr:two-component system, OmpR family, sensor histidine kinase VicK [Acidimicrobiaceae bacterium]
MTSTVAQIQFAAEFVTFLVAAAGLALVVLRNELTTSRPPERLALTIGFLATAVAAFTHGALLLTGDLEAIVIALRIGGVVGLAIGSIWWWRGRGIAGHLLWLGLFGTSIAIVLEGLGAGRASDAVLATGSIMIGTALLVASRRSVAARVAASAAGTLLLVVLVLSVALSAVLSSSIQREELSRLQSRASTEANLASTAFNNEFATARYAGLFLTGRGQLTDIQVNDLFDLMQALYPVGGLEFLAAPAPAANGVPSGGGRIVAAKGLDKVTATLLAGIPIVSNPSCSDRNRGSAYVINNQVLAVAVYPLCGSGTPTNPNPVVIGMVVRARPLDNRYLADRNNDEPLLSLAIVDQRGPLATVGHLPPTRDLTSIGAAVLATSQPVNRVVGNQYVAAKPIQAGNQAGSQVIAAAVVSAPTSAVIATRDRLFRTLFLIALGGTLIALGLAVVIGDRITAGLRRLTLVAESIQRGQRGERAGITSDDEVGVLGAAFDSMADSIEEQTRALRAAADDETRLRSRLEAVVAGMGDALVAVDALGKVTDFNQAAEEMTGIAAARAIGQPVDQVVRLVNEDGASLGPRLRTPSPSRWGMLATALELTGAEFPVAISAGALRGPGNELVGQVLVLRDLRREREVERMKTEFLSRVGHELRTPLTGIMGYADFLLRRTVPAERAQVAYEEILVSAKRLLRVVEMLEFFASSGAGRVLLRPEPMDVRQLLDAVVTPWSERLTPPNTITRRLARRIPEINGDRRWLALAIDELLDNAVKFSPGGAQVTVTAVVTTGRPPQEPARFSGPGSSTPSPDGPGSVPVLEISVMDRGKGMTPEEQATAFGEFVQGDSSDTRQFGGLGLGLSLVQRVVEGHGGVVKCTSLSGRGSTFTIVLPLPPDMEPDPSEEHDGRQDDPRDPQREAQRNPERTEMERRRVKSSAN